MDYPDDIHNYNGCPPGSPFTNWADIQPKRQAVDVEVEQKFGDYECAGRDSHDLRDWAHTDGPDGGNHFEIYLVFRSGPDLPDKRVHVADFCTNCWGTLGADLHYTNVCFERMMADADFDDWEGC